MSVLGGSSSVAKRWREQPHRGRIRGGAGYQQGYVTDQETQVSDMARDDDTRVIGYFAYTPPMYVVCDGDACIIAGSEAGMKRYIEAMVSGSRDADQEDAIR